MPLTVSPENLGFEPYSKGGKSLFQLPFKEQIDFFKGKAGLLLPSEHWDDILKAAHDRAFMVAGAAKADLLSDLYQAVQKTIDQGGTLEGFRKDFAKTVQAKGWDYTGAFDWRTRVIYQTNLSASYAAGRWAQLNHPDLLKNRPYWKYVHTDSVAHPRPLHLKWNGLTLRHDDPWWQAHFPPNGYGCRCRVTAVVNPDPDKDTAPDDGTYEKVDRWGEVHRIPSGVDYGWDYAPGANANTQVRTLVQDKLIGYRPAIAKALARDVNRYVNVIDQARDFAGAALHDRSLSDPLWLGFTESAEAIKAATGVDVNGYLVLLPPEAPRHIDRTHGHDGDGQRPASLEDYDKLQDILTDYDSIRLGEPSRHGYPTLVVTKAIGGEVYRCVWEVLPGKKNRALALVTMSIKTG